MQLKMAAGGNKSAQNAQLALKPINVLNSRNGAVRKKMVDANRTCELRVPYKV